MTSNPDLLGLCRRGGVTRLANLAGLDELNVPVWSCVRPGSRTVATSFGKGLTDEHAQISAVMEALEGACAEDRERIICKQSSVNELQNAGVSIVPLHKLDRCDPDKILQDVNLDWVSGTSLISGQAILGPFELVGMDYERRSGPIAAGFHMNSSGLGAGFNWEAAAQHAILELVEHEVTATIEDNPVLLSFYDAMAYQRGSDVLLDQAMKMFPPELIRPVFRDIPNKFGLSVVICELFEGELMQSTTTMKAMGFACRMDRRAAALAALLEAAQVRMGRIVGAREDIKWSHYKPDTAAVGDNHKVMMQKALPLMAFVDVENTTSHSLELLLSKLTQSGVHDIWTFNLNQPEDPFFVVRALADGLQDSSPEVINLGGAAIDSLLGLLKLVK